MDNQFQNLVLFAEEIIKLPNSKKKINNESKKISDYSFIHLGQCIHADIIKDFLKENKVKYYEEN